MEILSFKKFRSSPDFQFSKGTWIVEYNDETHLSDGSFICLGKVKIEECAPNGNCLFHFYPRTSEKLEKCIKKEWNSNAWKGKLNDDQIKGQPERAAKTIPDQLRESLVRLGILRLHFEIDNQKFISKRDFAIIILDTNALRNGSIRHFREQFPTTQLWIIIPTVTLMEMGERAETIKSRVNDKPKPSNSALIRSRPQVTIASQSVKWIKDRFPTENLELAPELLRTFRGYETRSSISDAYKEPNRLSINDRLILEGIKDLRRQRNLSNCVYLMSGDKDMSRLARLEGIQTIYPAMPEIQDIVDGVYSIRYSLESQTHVVCSIHRFLWDLTHVFSKIRVRKCTEDNQKSEKLELSYYYPTKLVNDWVDDKLEVTGFGSCSTAEVV